MTGVQTGGEARAFIEFFGANAPHPAAMHGNYHFVAGDGFDIPVKVDDGWYTDGVWTIHITGGLARQAVRTDVVKFERIDTALTDAGDKQVDLADVFGYGPSAPGWIEPSLEEA